MSNNYVVFSAHPHIHRAAEVLITTSFWTRLISDLLLKRFTINMSAAA
jgi:hypothetical protein